MEKNEARLTIAVPMSAKAAIERIALAEGRPSANLSRMLLLESLSLRLAKEEANVTVNHQKP